MRIEDWVQAVRRTAMAIGVNRRYLRLRIETKLRPASLGVRLHFAAVLLRRGFESAQTAHFLENALGIQLILQPLQSAIDWLTFANEYFWHR
jgi:hypothetical protein